MSLLSIVTINKHSSKFPPSTKIFCSLLLLYKIHKVKWCWSCYIFICNSIAMINFEFPPSFYLFFVFLSCTHCLLFFFLVPSCICYFEITKSFLNFYCDMSKFHSLPPPTQLKKYLYVLRAITGCHTLPLQALHRIPSAATGWGLHGTRFHFNHSPSMY